MNMRISKKLIASIFLFAVILGAGGIHGLRMLMTANYAKSPEGQSILGLPLEVATNVLAVGFIILMLAWQLRAQHSEIKESLERKLQRIAEQAGELIDRAAELKANPYIEHRLIWKRSAWDSSRDFLSDHLHVPGLLYVMDDFYMAADALRDADLYRFNHILDEKDPNKVPSIVSAHIANFEASSNVMVEALAEQGYYVPGRRVADKA